MTRCEINIIIWQQKTGAVLSSAATNCWYWVLVSGLLLLPKIMMVWWLWYGVRMLAQKQAANFGDGDSLVAFIRDSIGDYHLQGKVMIIQIACARMVVAQGYIFGFCRWSTGEAASGGSSWQWGSLEKDGRGLSSQHFAQPKRSKRQLLCAQWQTHLGQKDTNVEGDIVVEHLNKIYKVGAVFAAKILQQNTFWTQDFLAENLKGNYEEERIATMAVSIDINRWGLLLCGIQKKPSLHSDESLVRRPRLGKNGADFSEQVTEAVSKCKVGFVIVVLLWFLFLLLRLSCCCWFFLIYFLLLIHFLLVLVVVLLLMLMFFIKFFSGGFQVHWGKEAAPRFL